MMLDTDQILLELQAIRTGQQNIMDKVNDINIRLTVIESREKPSESCRNFIDAECVQRDELGNLHQELHDTQVIRERNRLQLFSALLLLFGGSGIGIIIEKLLTI